MCRHRTTHNACSQEYYVDFGVDGSFSHVASWTIMQYHAILRKFNRFISRPDESTKFDKTRRHIFVRRNNIWDTVDKVELFGEIRASLRTSWLFKQFASCDIFTSYCIVLNI